MSDESPKVGFDKITFRGKEIILDGGMRLEHKYLVPLPTSGEYLSTDAIRDLVKRLRSYGDHSPNKSAKIAYTYAADELEKLLDAEKEIDAMTTDYLSTLSELADRLRILHSASLEADGPNNEDLKRAYQAVIDDLRRAEEVRKRLTKEEP